ncbi:MAG: glycosyltransferase family 4 protein [Vulcanimicrobiaceae bacterium]
MQPLRAEEREQVERQYGLRRPVVGYVGRLVPQKGVDLLVKAMAKVPRAQVVIGGDGPTRGELEDLARKLGIADRVTFLGNLSPNESLRVIGSLDVCTLPSRTTSFWKDQQPRVPVEAMAQGVPIVGSSSGGIPETIGNAGLIFPEDDVDAFAQCISRALDPSERKELTRRGLDRAREEFSLDRATDVLQEALERSIQRS